MKYEVTLNVGYQKKTFRFDFLDDVKEFLATMVDWAVDEVEFTVCKVCVREENA